MMTKAAAARYWNALSDDDFERRQRFIDHFAAIPRDPGDGRIASRNPASGVVRRDYPKFKAVEVAQGWRWSGFGRSEVAGHRGLC
jgi:hypothetical protein